MNATLAAPSFYATAPGREEADDLWESYFAVLRARNGDLDVDHGFDRREADMADMATWDGTFSGRVDPERFAHNYDRFDGRDLTDAELALLAFCKVNAGEAYGVEVTARARARKLARDEPIFRVEKVLAHEETYHTRILVGATQHFEGVAIESAWRPPLSLKLLVFCLATFPDALYHPVLLGSEIAGVFTFNWMLCRLKTLFPDDPEVRESMERRLVEILVDEVGHVAFNRVAVGPAAIRIARPLAARVLASTKWIVPELVALGMDDEARRRLADFDLRVLPREVRDRAWFA